MHGTSKTHVVAVERMGIISRFDGKTWKHVKPVTNQLNGVWAHPTGGTYVVGSGGVILHRAP